MTWEIEISSSAKKEMRSLTDSMLRRVKNKILNLSENPFPIGTIKLKDSSGYRLRVGNWRIIYSVNASDHIITIFAVRHRSKAYS